MTRRLSIEWPDPAPFRARGGAPIRLLATSDVLDPALADRRNRDALRPIDLLLCCGDLDSTEIAFLADGFDAPVLHVLGNHDDRSRWGGAAVCPDPMASASVTRSHGLAVAGLPWPGETGRYATRSETAAWGQALRLATGLIRRPGHLIVISHAPPLGCGDVADGTYHRGFRAYRWLMGRMRPTLWLHGHTPLAASREWRIRERETTLVNVSGGVLLELRPPS